MEDRVKQLLANTIQLAEQANKEAEKRSVWFKHECSQLKPETEMIESILRHAAKEILNPRSRARINSQIHRPKLLIIGDTQHVLVKTLMSLRNCRSVTTGLINRLFRGIPTANALFQLRLQLAESISNLEWLLYTSYIDPPQLTGKEPSLGLISEIIMKLHTGHYIDRSLVADTLYTLIRNRTCTGRMVVKEGGVRPLLKVMEEGSCQGQESAARAIAILGSDPENVDHIIRAGVSSVFAKILIEGALVVQEVVAWGVASMAKANHKFQHNFAQHGIVRLLMTHLLDPQTKHHPKLKDMAARALWHLAIDNALVADQVLQIVVKEERRDILIDSVTGNLARKLRARELRKIGPFARHLDGGEAAISLSKLITIIRN